MFLRLKLWLYAAAGVLVAVAAAYFRGRSDQSEANHKRELNEYVDTRKRMDQADVGDDADASREWLRNRNK